MDTLMEIGLFSAKAFVIVVAIIAVLLFITVLKLKNKFAPDLEIKNLNDKWKDTCSLIKTQILTKKELKKETKENKKKNAENKKKEEKPKRAFVLDFKGDIKASAVKKLRNEISAILSVAQKNDEIILNLESPGGLVSSYGLAAAQLLRIRNKGLNLTVCVDKVAASGGYMMACTANKILVAPFAILGSIGVLAQIPNFHKILKKNDVDYFELTAGEFKRTLTLFGDVSDKKVEKQKEQILHIHDLFKSFVKQNREKLDIDKVATGEYWFGTKALELKLADEVMTSDEYISNKFSDTTVFSISTKEKKKFIDKLTQSAAKVLEKKILENISDFKFPYF